MASTAPLLVLTDRDLLPRIGAFTSGVPFALVQFWLRYKPEQEPPLKGFWYETHRVVEKLVEFGTIQLLELATQVWIPSWAPYRPNPLDLHHVVKYATQYRRPEMLQWGIVNAYNTNDRPVEVWHSVIVDQYRDGDAPLLDVLNEHLPVSEGDLLEYVFGCPYSKHLAPNMELVRWLDTHLAMPKVMVQIAISAAYYVDLETVQFLHERGVRFRCNKKTFRVLSDEKQWELLAFLLEHNHVKVDHETAMEMVLSEEEPVCELVRRFAPKFQSAFEDQVRAQVEYPRADQLITLVENDAFTIDFPISIDEFAAEGELEVIMLLHEKGLATATTEAMDIAAECEFWDVVEFLHENRSEGCTTRAMDAAAWFENLEYVKFFHENRSEGCSTEAMDVAAKEHHMGVLRYLHENSSVGCTTAAMDGAAKSGHLDVVKFLHENRTEGCTTAAMDEAATHGHMAILRYLHENSTVGCSPNAMNGAAQNGRLDAVKFLHDHRKAPCTVAAMNEAAAYGHLDVLRYLHENRIEDCTVDTVKMALRYSRPLIVAFLREQYPQLFGPEILHDVLLHGAFDIFMDLREVFPEEASTVMSDVAFQAGAQHELSTIRFIANVLKRDDLVSRVIDGAMSREDSRDRTLWLKAIAAATELSNGSSTDAEKKATQENGDVEANYFFFDPKDEENDALDAFQKDGDVGANQAKAEQDQLHPFLRDPRTPSWAISGELNCFDSWTGPYEGLTQVHTWAQRAVYANDMRLLELLHDTPPDAFPKHDRIGYEISPSKFGFGWTREAAIRSNNFPILRWLIEKVDLPIEPTLLGWAVFYHRYEIAEWLVANCPEACQESNWRANHFESVPMSCGLQDDLLDWLETHPSVRAALDFRSIIDFAVRKDDAESLRKLVQWVPELVLSRPNLAATDDSDVLAVLKEIGYQSA